MPVEQLAIVEGPLAGVDNETRLPIIPAACEWMNGHGIKPLWVVGGGVAGALLSEETLKGAAKGMALAAVASWVLSRCGYAPQAVRL